MIVYASWRCFSEAAFASLSRKAMTISLELLKKWSFEKELSFSPSTGRPSEGHLFANSIGRPRKGHFIPRQISPANRTLPPTHFFKYLIKTSSLHGHWVFVRPFSLIMDTTVYPYVNLCFWMIGLEMAGFEFELHGIAGRLATWGRLMILDWRI